MNTEIGRYIPRLRGRGWSEAAAPTLMLKSKLTNASWYHNSGKNMGPIIVYTMGNCPNCDKLKAPLMEVDIPFEERNLETKEAIVDLRCLGCFPWRLWYSNLVYLL